jgi:hypothetical protein
MIVPGVRGAALLVVAAIASFGLRAEPPPRFPLRVSANHRHLEDASGKPFLVVGDAAWSLVAQLDDASVSTYLDDRATRGFTSIIVNLIEHKFATHAPSNRAGVSPFLEPGDFRTPNVAYFDSAHRAVSEAARRGISVWLCPAYLGWDGGDEGFFKEINKAGPDALHAYGKFVGERFKDLPNVVWMLGGDYALPPQYRWAGEELASGLRDGGARQLITAHGGQTSAVETYGDQPWLAVETVYNYKPDLRPALLRAYEQGPIRPFVLIETIYEGEHHARPDQIRRQAWQAMLSGAAGQFFGNNPIWHFDGPTLFPFTGDWKQALDSTGSRDMARLAAFFGSREWWTLQPRPNAGPTIVMAAAPGGLTVIYLAGNGSTHAQEISLPIPALSPSAKWFNPARDEPLRPVETTGATGGGTHVTTPGDNGTGTNDWVIVE